MDAATLQDATPGMSLARAQQLLPGLLDAAKLAALSTVNRMAMFIAQTREESVNYNATEEYASGAEYEGRADLGNTQPGDGVRFKGRSFIQITGRANYASFSAWAYGLRLVPSRSYFLDYPTALAEPRWAWIGAAWFWSLTHYRDTTQWHTLNAASDAGDVIGATWIINGGQNGIDTRIANWNHVRALGTRLLVAAPPQAGRKARMFALLFDTQTGIWYQTGFGFFDRLGTAANVAASHPIMDRARNPLCVNGDAVLAVVAGGLTTAQKTAAMGRYRRSTAQLGAIKTLNLDLGKR